MGNCITPENKKPEKEETVSLVLTDYMIIEEHVTCKSCTINYLESKKAECSNIYETEKLFKFIDKWNDYYAKADPKSLSQVAIDSVFKVGRIYIIHQEHELNCMGKEVDVVRLTKLAKGLEKWFIFTSKAINYNRSLFKSYFIRKK